MGFKPKKINSLTYEITNNNKIPVKIYASDAIMNKMISDRTISQAINVSKLSGIQKHVIILPDGHEGYGFPVGGVAATDSKEGVISPGGVGYDINCGVRLLRTNLKEHDIRPKLKNLVLNLFNSIPTGIGSKSKIRINNSQFDEIITKGVRWAVNNGYAHEDDITFCEENGCMTNVDHDKISNKAYMRGSKQLGSLGSGNHFLEIQKVHKIYDENAAKIMGIEENQITILTHCGSRGFGHQICSDYLKISEQSLQKYNIKLEDKELACVPNMSEEGESYRKAMSAALNFAWCNRQIITYLTRKSFEKILQQSESDLEMNLVYDVSHNIAKTEKHKIDNHIKSVIVHRKGATRAFPAQSNELPIKYKNIGQPVFIPGSMGTASWILLGQPNSMDLSFGSTAHGAGRLMSRTKARRNYTQSQVQKLLNERGVFIKSLTSNGIVEESPYAYKDVDAVVDVSHKLGIATKVAKLVPIGVIKG